jgi:hypothetical protein
MPVGWAIGAAAVGSVASAAIGADAAKDAARTQRAGAADASAVQREMFNTMNRQQQPFMESGYGANAELSRLLGIMPQSATGGAPGTGSSRAGELIMNRGGIPAVNQDLYASDPGYRQAWDRTLQWEQQNRPGWSGQQTYFMRANDADWARLNESLTRNLAEYDAQQPAGGRQSPGSEWRPTAGGGVERAITMGPGGAGGESGGVPATGPTGLPTGYLSQTFGPQQFLAGMDPGYQWRAQQGAQGVMNGASAASGSLSGPALKALLEYNQGAASQEFGASFDRFQTQQGNIFQRLSSIANLGQNASAGVGAQGVATAGNIGSNIVGAANASAAGQIGAANAYGGALSDLGALGFAYGTGRRP